MKRIALITAIVFLVLTLLVVMWRLQSVVGIFLIALVIGMTVEVPILAIMRRGAPRWLAVLAVYAGALLVIFVLGGILFRPLASELDPLIQDGLTHYGVLQARLEQIASDRSVLLVGHLPRTEEVAAMIVKNADAGIGQGMLATAQRMLGMAGELALAVVIAVYWSMDRSRFERLWLSLLSPSQRLNVRGFLSRLENTLGAYTRSEIVQTVLAGALLTGLYVLIGIEYPFWLALLASVLWLIPIMGGALAVAAALLIGWFASWQTALLAATLTILILGIMETLVQPRLYGNHQQVWGILTIVLMLLLGDALGLIGLLIAPPVALALQMIFDAILERNPNQPAITQDITLASLRDEVEQLRLRASDSNHPTAKAMAGLTDRLQTLVDAAEKAST